jgi:hypothetical protein
MMQLLMGIVWRNLGMLHMPKKYNGEADP